MKWQVFTVFDSAAGHYMPLFSMRAKGEAVRAFMDMVKDPNHRFGQSPKDYTLFHVGEWDDSTCAFAPFSALLSLGIGSEFASRDAAQGST